MRGARLRRHADRRDLVAVAEIEPRFAVLRAVEPFDLLIVIGDEADDQIDCFDEDQADNEGENGGSGGGNKLNYDLLRFP